MKKLIFISIIIFPLFLFANHKPFKLLDPKNERVLIEKQLSFLLLEDSLNVSDSKVAVFHENCDAAYNLEINLAISHFNAEMNMLRSLGSEYFNAFSGGVINTLAQRVKFAEANKTICNRYYNSL